MSNCINNIFFKIKVTGRLFLIQKYRFEVGANLIRKNKKLVH